MRFFLVLLSAGVVLAQPSRPYNPFNQLCLPNMVVAGPVTAGGAAYPTCRFLVPADIGGVGLTFQGTARQIATQTVGATITFSLPADLLLSGQSANGTDMLSGSRATDTSPTGNFLNFKSLAGVSLWQVDVTGTLQQGVIPWARITSVPTFLTPANNLSDVSSASTARTNLGLGTAATQNLAAFLQPVNNLSELTNVSTARGNLGLGSYAVLANPMTTLGDLNYGGASGVPTRLAGDTSNTRKFLREQSSGGVATAPAWDTFLIGDIPSGYPFSSLGNPTASLALAMGNNTFRYTFGSSTSTPDLWIITDGSGNIGTGHLFRSTTAAGSAASPWQADVNGTGWQVGSCAVTGGCGALVSVNAAPVVGPVIDNQGQVINVKAFGAKGDGSTDDSVAIQNAIGACPSLGGQVYFPPGRYKITTGLTYGNGSNSGPSTVIGCALVGAGSIGGLDSDGGPGGAASTLLWFGPNAGTMLTINGPITGVRVENLRFDAEAAGANPANTCLLANHPTHSTFRNLQCRLMSGIGFSEQAYNNPTGFLNGANENLWEQLSFYSTIGGSKGMQIGGATTGGANLDVAKNTFINIMGGAMAAGIEMRNMDNAVFVNIHVTANAGPGLLITAPTSTTGPNAIWCYYCEFGEVGTPVTISGTWNPSSPIVLWPFAQGPLLGNLPGVLAMTTEGSISPMTFASLPTCASAFEGSMRSVNDSTTNTWGATITGGSTNHVLAYCDGTNWTVAGK